MSFSNRELLVLAILLPILIAYLLIRYVKRRRMVVRTLGDAHLIARLGGADLHRFPVERFALLIPAAILLGIACAGPHWGIKAVEGESRSLNVVLGLDISKSMLARDVSPNRLERERLLVRRLLRDLAQERVGMVVFAGRAYILAPLTSDQGALNLFVDALDPDIVSQGGSSVAAAISLSADLARGPQGAAGERAVVMITDGEAQEPEEDIMQAVARAQKLHVKIFPVAVGTTQGAPIPEIDPETHAVTGYKRDPFGTTVISKSNPQLLQKIAQMSGGKSYDLARGGSTDDLVRQLRKLQRTPGTTDAGVEPRDQTPWFIGLALLLLIADFVTTQRRRVGMPVRTVNQQAVAAALILLMFGTGFAIGELERGNRYYRGGHYAEAVKEYEKAIANGNDAAEIRYNLGTAYLRLGKYEDAERHLRLALREMKPEVRQRAFYNLGNRYLESARKGTDPQAAKQMLDGAVDAYKQSLRLMPGDMDAKWNLELALREKEKQNKSPAGGGSNDKNSNSDQDKSPKAGGGTGNSSQGQSSAGQGKNPGQQYEQRPMSQEQADRILSAVEQDERQLTREKLKKGERQTPVARDW